jgi:hypothetical protein
MTNDLAQFSSESYSRDELIAGSTELHHQKVTLLSGQNQVRGALLGRKITAATVEGAAGAGNTGGSGAIGTLSAGTGAQVGVYRAICIEPAANAGTFAVYDPNGVFIGHATVAVAFTGEVNFTIADATDFVAGDFFTITVSAPTYKYLLSLAAAVDGSQVPVAILAGDCDASLADAEALVYTTGDFNDAVVTFGTGYTAATVREALALRGIHLIDVMGA